MNSNNLDSWQLGGFALLLGFFVAAVTAVPDIAYGQEAQDLEEIMVTARKREEDIKDVPIFVQSLSADVMFERGIVNSEDFIGTLPSVSKSGDFLSPSKEFSLLVIRGVGANGGMEPAAPVFVDGVYLPRLGFDADFFGAERVEVLYGPQSTLFGRNTEAGAINIITKRPGDELEGRLGFEIAEFGTYKAGATISGPLSDTLFGGIAVQGSQTNGYLGNVGAANSNEFGAGQDPGAFFFGELDDEADDPDKSQDINVRASLRWVPNDKFEAYLTADSSRFKGGNGAPGVPRGCDCYDLDVDAVYNADDKNSGAMLELSYDADAFNITSITAYRDLETSQPFDFDGGSNGPPGGTFASIVPGANGSTAIFEIPGVTNSLAGNIQDFRFEQDIFSQEFRLSSNSDGAFHWLVGAYYFNESFLSDRNMDILGSNQLPFTLRVQDVVADRDGWAAFGQVSFDVSENVELSLGLRYSDEEADAFSIQLFEALWAGLEDSFPNGMFGGSNNTSVAYDGVNYSASLRWTLSDSVTAYFTTATAYKAPGFQLAPSGSLPGDNPYGAEEATSYELGFKFNTGDGRLVGDLAFFLIDLEDQQVRTIRLINGVPFTNVQNGATTENTGVSLDLTWMPTDHFRFGASIGYVDATYEDFLVELDNAGNTLSFADEPVRFTPELTADLSLEWQLPIESNWFDSVSLWANYQYVDEIIQGFDGISVDVELMVDSYDQTDIGAHFNINDRTRATFYINNVTDEYIETRAWNVFFFTNAGDTNRVMSTVLPPRHAGFRLIYDF